MRATISSDELMLMDAALKLRLSYHQVLRLIQQGTLHGERRDGHWYVMRASLRRVLRQRANDE